MLVKAVTIVIVTFDINIFILELKKSSIMQGVPCQNYQCTDRQVQ